MYGSQHTRNPWIDTLIIILALILLIILLATQPEVILFEDGSWLVTLNGCLPWGICY